MATESQVSASPGAEASVGRPVSVPEVLEILQADQTRRAELAYEQKLALEHATTFSRVPAEKARELKAKLREIPRVQEHHAVKLIDLAPTHPDDVRAIFARDRSPLEKDDIDKILEAVRSFL